MSTSTVSQSSTHEHTPMAPIRERSSWVSSILYKRVGQETYIAVFLKTEPKSQETYIAVFLKTEPKSEPVALLYGGPESLIPSYLPGLLHAHRSPGRAYNLLLKGKGYTYQRVEGREKVRELKEMMK